MIPGAATEGVETDQNLARLVELGCDSVHGYHVSKPVAPATLTPWLFARRRGRHPNAPITRLRIA